MVYFNLYFNYNKLKKGAKLQVISNITKTKI